MKKSYLSYVSFFTVLLFSSLFAACSGDGVRNAQNESATYNSSSSGVSAKSTESSVDLGWDLEGEEFKITYYDANGAKLGEVVVEVNNAFIDNLPKDKSYTFLIESDNESIFAFASTAKGTQPSRIGAIANDRSAKIIWEAIPDALEYELYVSTSENGNYAKVGTYQDASAKVLNLINGVTYFFRVQANFNKDSIKVKRQLLKHTLDAGNTQIQLLSLVPGYSFGEVTAVTPSDIPYIYIKNFRAYKRGFKVHFSWDALAQAKSYNLKHSKNDDNYTTHFNTVINSYILELPVENKYYRVAGVFDDGFDGFLSQLIKLRYSKTPEWEINGYIAYVEVKHANFDEYDKVELYCIGEGESEWFHTEMTKQVFTAGWLEGGKIYTCKLKVTLDDAVSESGTKKVYVKSPIVPDRLVSIYVWDNNAELRWSTSIGGEYNVYLIANGNGIIKVTEGLEADIGDNTAYEVSGLECNVNYRFVVMSTENSSVYTWLFSDEFMLNTDYCENEKKYGFRKLNPKGTPPKKRIGKKTEETFYRKCSLSGGINSIVYGDKIYIAVYDGVFTFDPSYETDGLWTKINSGNGTQPYAIGIYDDKLYAFGGEKQDFTSSSDWFVMDLKTEGKWTKLNIDNVCKPLNGNYRSFLINDKFYIPQNKQMCIYDPKTNVVKTEDLKFNYLNQNHTFLYNNLIYNIEMYYTGKIITYDPVTKIELETKTDFKVDDFTFNDFLLGYRLYNSELYFFKYRKIHTGQYITLNTYNMETQRTRKIYPLGEIPFTLLTDNFIDLKGVLYAIGGHTPDNCSNDIYSYKP